MFMDFVFCGLWQKWFEAVHISEEVQKRLIKIWLHIRLEYQTWICFYRISYLSHRVFLTFCNLYLSMPFSCWIFYSLRVYSNFGGFQQPWSRLSSMFVICVVVVMMMVMTPPLMMMTNWRNASGGELSTETFHSHTQEMQQINFSSQAQLLCTS